MSARESPPVRLVATDLDGTLLRSDGTVGPRTRDVLARLDAARVAVVFVTGRPVRWVDQLAEHVGDHGLVICANGAVLYDVRRAAVIEALPMPPEAAREAVAALRSGLPGVRFALESVTGFGREPDYPEYHPYPPGSGLGPIEDLLDSSTVKLLVRHEELPPAAFLDRARELVGGGLVVTASGAGPLVEISGPGVTKAATLARFSAEHGIAAAEVIAFGDMLNDLPMLEWAGTSVAVANAHPEVLARADLVAPANDEDGVATVLEQLLERMGRGPE